MIMDFCNKPCDCCLSKCVKAIGVYRKFCESLIGCSCDQDDVQPGCCVGCEAMATLYDVDDIFEGMDT